MKLESINSYAKDMRTMRIIVFTISALSIVSVAFAFWYAQEAIKKESSKAWVVYDGQPLLAQSADQFNYEGRRYELETLARTWYLKTFSVDDQSYDAHLKSMVNLSREFRSGLTPDQYWEEENIENNVFGENWIYQAYIDSVIWNYNSSPIKGYLFGKQKITTKRNTAMRNMYVAFEVKDNLKRSIQNSFGADLDQMDIFNNKLIKPN